MPPTIEELRARRKALNQNTQRRSVWQTITEPLTDAPSRISRDVSKNLFGKTRENLGGSKWSENAAKAIGFYEGATEGLGDVLTSLTSPLDLIATLSGAGSLSRGARTANLARKAFTAANVGTAARGGQNLFEGLDLDSLGSERDLESLITGEKEWKPDLGQVGAGALELGTSALGLKKPPIRPNPVKTEVKPKKVPLQIPERTGLPRFLVNPEGQAEDVFARNLAPVKESIIIPENLPNARQFKDLSDKMLEVRVRMGDKDAIKELGIRRGETGAVGSNIQGGPIQKLRNLGTSIKNTINLNLVNQDLPNVQRLKDDYQTWVNERNARKGLSYTVRENFKDLKDLGIEGIFAYNRGERGGRLADVQKFFDDYHADFDARRKALGVKENLGFKENYLPQIWDNSLEEITQALGNKKLTLKPRIAMKSIIDTYEEGIAKGLTPKYKNITDLMGYYTEVAEKNIADRKFYKSLREKNLILPSTSKKVRPEWKELPGDIFPQIRPKKGGRISWKASPEVAEIITNYLEPRNKVMSKALEGIQITKDIALASGLPGTAFNAHGFNMLRRSTAVNGMSGFVNALKYMTKSGSDSSIFSRTLNEILPWKSADDTIKQNLDLLPEVMEYGGRLGVEGHEFGEQLATNIFGKGVQKIKGWHQDLFETHLFDKMIPALKIDYYKSSVSDLIKTMPIEEAKKEAARAMNLAFAGVNYDELATNKHILDFARLFLLAPDWYASNIGLMKNAGQSLMNSNHPGAKLYKNAAAGMLSIYTASNILNYLNTGNFMWENESGRTFDIDTGTYTINEKGTKKKVYISPFGTAFDAAKIPMELITNAFKGDIDKLPSTLKNRTSLPAHSMVNFLSNTNDFGEKMFGQDVYGRDIPLETEIGNLASDVLFKPVTPAYVQGARGLFTGRMSPLEGSSQMIEAPLIFKRQDTSRRRRRRSR